MKRCIAALALALLAFPGAALAGPQHEARHFDRSIPGGSVAVPRDLRAPDQRGPRPTPSYLPTTGTDVAAADQQASTRADAPASTFASTSADDGFDWADAGIGAAGAASLLGISLAGLIALRRRQDRHPSALAG
jgi:hypothetical protein